ncbi:hypothetical protein FOCC_FOCC013444 [Frankliniella occidentalis]|nr:hypothetical protein FOCC_FOCC013444 [Frankliniella occidentalis]
MREREWKGEVGRLRGTNKSGVDHLLFPGLQRYSLSNEASRLMHRRAMKRSFGMHSPLRLVAEVVRGRDHEDLKLLADGLRACCEMNQD